MDAGLLNHSTHSEHCFIALGIPTESAEHERVLSDGRTASHLGWPETHYDTDLHGESTADMEEIERAVGGGRMPTSGTNRRAYPGCWEDALNALQLVLSLGMDQCFVIHTLLMWIDEVATWSLAEQIGRRELVELIIKVSLACHIGNRSHRHE